MYDVEGSEWLLKQQEGFTSRHIEVERVVKLLSAPALWHMHHKPYANDYPAELVRSGGRKYI